MGGQVSEFGNNNKIGRYHHNRRYSLVIVFIVLHKKVKEKS